MPRGSRPSTAVCTSLGARNASEIVILTCRMLHISRAAIWSTLTLPAMISSSQRRPRAIDATSVARVSARIGRASCGAADRGTMISRRRFAGRFLPGHTENNAIRLQLTGIAIRRRPVFAARSLFLLWHLELDHQVICLHIDAGDMGADEVSVRRSRILQVFADGLVDDRFDLGRRHSAHRTCPACPALDEV